MKPSSLFFPSYEWSVDAASGRITVRDDSVGYLGEWNGLSAQAALSNGVIVGAHRGKTINFQTDWVPCTTALDFETQFHRLAGKASPLMSGDKTDTSPSSHTTGGGRRSFVATGLQRALRGLPDGLAALQSWARCQENRPVAHLPWDFTYNGFKGVLTSGVQYDTMLDLNGKVDNKMGWAVYDPAHLESAPLFSGAVAGDLECLTHFIWLTAWVIRSTVKPGSPAVLQTLWRGSGQERAIGWHIWILTRACLLGLDTADPEFLNTFFGGVKPKDALKMILEDVVATPLGWGAGNVDIRTMPLVPAGYGWQNGIILGAVGYLLRSGIVNDPLKSKVSAYFTARAADHIKRVVGPDPTRGGKLGVSYSCSAAEWDDAMLAKVQAADTTKQFEFAPGTKYIRTVPRLADAELTLGGLWFMLGMNDPTVVSLMSSIPGPTNMSAYDDTSRYIDPVWADAER